LVALRTTKYGSLRATFATIIAIVSNEKTGMKFEFW